MAPAIMTPARIDKKAFLKLNLNATPASEPVQAPVTGNGMATNSISPTRLYLSIILPRRRARLSSHSKYLLKILTLPKCREMATRNNRMIGTGMRLPARASRKALYHGRCNSNMASGMAPRSSIIGRVATIMTISSGGKPESRSALIMLSRIGILRYYLLISEHEHNRQYFPCLFVPHHFEIASLTATVGTVPCAS